MRMTMLTFTKMNGAGNDFVMIDNRDLRHSLDRVTISRLCDRHRGIGADGLIAVEPAQGSADFRMRYYNADGGEAEMCGNGARCFARFASRLAGKSEGLSFDTLAGVISAKMLGDRVQLQMSVPKDLAIGSALPVHEENLTVHSVNTGVPHAVVVVDDIGNVDVRRIGSAIRYHEFYAPKGTNANFIEVQGPGLLAIRTYERGVEDETLACGTGVCAAALIHSALTGAESPVEVRVKGGDTLSVGFTKSPEGFTNVTLTGPADFVFDGQVSL
jgi:diaminopimelate epimerase